MTARACVCTAALVVAGHVTLATAQPVVRLSRDGRTLAIPTAFDERHAIVFDIEPGGSAPCFSTRPEAGRLEIHYQFVNEPEQPDTLPATSDTATIDGRLHTIPPSSTGRFVVFNLWERSADVTTATERAELFKCLTQRRAAQQVLDEKKSAVDQAEVRAREATTELESFAAQEKRLVGAIAAYQHVGGNGTDRVVALQETLARVQAQSQKAAAKLKAAVAEATGAKAQLAAEEARLGTTAADFIASSNRLSGFLQAKTLSSTYFEALVLRVGGILARRTDKAVYYDLWERKPTDVVAIVPMGSQPAVRYGDRLFAVLTNVLLGSFDQPFAIRIKEQAGSVINTSPVRPVFSAAAVRSAAESAAGPPEPRVTTSAAVFRDVFLPVTGAFAPNDYAEVTIVTEANDADGNPKEVKIVDQGKFPQFRALYRYNLNTGVLQSRLRSPTFTKVKISDDNPETKDVNEAKYRTDAAPGHTQVLPMFAFTLYPVPVDIQGPVTQERWIPAPTVGFGFTNPGKEVFLGFSHEIVRNAQLIYGWHFGEVTELVTRNATSEDSDATAPVTQKGRDKAFAIGLSFNINIVKEIFK